MKPAPKTIYLHFHTEKCGEDCYDDETWCTVRASDDDIEYIRKDLYNALQIIVGDIITDVTEKTVERGKKCQEP